MDKTHTDSIKHTIRSLKKEEMRIRFPMGYDGDAKDIRLVWREFFDIKSPFIKKARYNLTELAKMNKDDYKSAISEFYFNVYYRMYKENHFNLENTYDSTALSMLGLPAYADFEQIKSRFRELAKKHHPDAGGANDEFIEIYKIYNELKNNRR